MMKFPSLFSFKIFIGMLLVSAAILFLPTTNAISQTDNFLTEKLTKASGNATPFAKNAAGKKINYKRLALVGSGLLALNVAAYQPFKETWWQEERTHFHLYRGWRRTVGAWDFGWNDSYYGHIDKLGHYYSSKIMSEQLSNLSDWVGFRTGASQWIGPVVSSLLMLEIEIYDGFFKEWGFSLADFTANELGAFSPLLTKKIPALHHFSLKFSYHPSRQPQNEPTFIKDYAGMTYWLSCDVSEILPSRLKNHYPQWLNFALGYGVSKQAHGDVELLLAPDVNWEKVYRGHSESLKFFFHALNYLHFPCFALKITPKVKFYPLYF